MERDRTVKRMTLLALAVAALALAQNSNPYLGSVPQGEPTAETQQLSLTDAIARGLKYNLGPVLAGENARSARAARLEALADLLPNFSARVSAVEQQVNLAAFGFTGLPGIPTIVGPFSVVDARAALNQTVFNLRSLDRYRASGEQQRAAELSQRDSRDIVVLAVTQLYLDALTGASRIEAAQAQAATAEALYSQAVEFKRNGIVPAIDVLRAQVEFQNQQQRVIALQNQHAKSLLRIGRAIGLPDGQAIALTDKVPYTPAPAVPVDELISRARNGRLDIQAASARLRAAEYLRKGAAAGRLPTLAFNSDYGVIGPNLTTLHGTFATGVALNIPIFQGGRVRADILRADADLEQRRAELADLRGRIAFDVRSASLDLQAAGRQVEVARSAVDLANQQVTQARDRFAAGVTNNVEVVQAQQQLAVANENLIASLYAFNTAKAALGRAVGGAEKSIPSLLLGGTF